MEDDIVNSQKTTVNDELQGQSSQEKNQLDISQIMEQVRENIKKRKNEGAYTEDDEQLLNSTKNQPVTLVENESGKYLQDLQNNWSIENKNYVISSHRKLIGPVLIAGRKIINGETRRYIDYPLSQQSVYNLSNIKIIEYLLNKLSTNEEQINSLLKNNIEINTIKSTLSVIEKHLEYLEGSDWSKIYSKEVTEKDLDFYMDYHKEFISMIEDYSKKCSNHNVPRLLEVGLGSAIFSIHFSRSAYSCVGLDNNPMIIKRAIETNRKLGGYAKFILVDAFELSMLKPDSFDIAFSQGTMEHFGNKDIVELILNQLKVAKYVMFSVPSVYYPYKEFGNERKMTIEEWRTMLENAGFNINYLDYYHDKAQIACIISKC